MKFRFAFECVVADGYFRTRKYTRSIGDSGRHDLKFAEILVRARRSSTAAHQLAVAVIVAEQGEGFGLDVAP